MRRRSLFAAGAAATVAGAAAAGALPAWARTDDGSEAGTAQTWESEEQWGLWEDGDYTLYNNLWGEGWGHQRIWANSHANWGVNADHPNTGGIKSYPNVSYTLGRNVWDMGDVQSSFQLTLPGAADGLAYNTAYDIWGDGHAHEIMLWVNWSGPVGPIGSQITTVDVGGHSWDYYQGSNGANDVYSFLIHDHTSAATIELTPIAQWLVEQGYMPEVQIDQIQLGWEITSAAGGFDFTVDDYSLTV